MWESVLLFVQLALFLELISQKIGRRALILSSSCSSGHSETFRLTWALRWLYRLFVGLDANFRLKRMNVSNQLRDPGLNHGYAYVVEDSRFRQHLCDYGDKVSDDKSTCNNHDAIKLANMRGNHGTDASGIGSVDCIRHDMKRANSIGDLQKGERYLHIPQYDPIWS